MNGAKMANAVIILGAGLGTRMNSDLPKVLHPIAGAPMLVHAMQAAMVLDPARRVVVAGYEAAQVEIERLAQGVEGAAGLLVERVAELSLSREGWGWSHVGGKTSTRGDLQHAA